MPIARLATFVPYKRDQTFLLPADDLAHFVLAAVGRLPMPNFAVNPLAGGKPQYHPRLMLALLIYCYANGLFSSRRTERAMHRDPGVRFVAANLHPDHDKIAAFRQANKAAFEAAFLEVLLLARGCGLLRLGTGSIDGTRIDANASKIRSVRYDRAQALRAKLMADIAELPPIPKTTTRRHCPPRSPGARRRTRSSTPLAHGSKPRRANWPARLPAEATRQTGRPT